MDPENTPQPKYFGVTFDMTLSYRPHIQNTKMNVVCRNNLLKKLYSSKRGTNTTKTTTMALCNPIAEYGAPVWVSSSHVDIMDPELNKV